MRTHVCVSVCVNICVCAHIRMYIYLCVCVCVCQCMCTYGRSQQNNDGFSGPSDDACMCVRACVYVCQWSVCDWVHMLALSIRLKGKKGKLPYPLSPSPLLSSALWYCLGGQVQTPI